MKKLLVGAGATFMALVLMGACSAAVGGDEAAVTPTATATATATPEADTDGDGVPDSEDAFMYDPSETKDSDDNGYGDNIQAETEALQEKAAAEQEKREATAEQAALDKKIKNAEPVSARTLSKILKDPDAHAGEILVVYGEIFQFDSVTGPEAFLGEVAHKDTTTYGYFDGENALFNGDEDMLSDLVEDDVFKATVEVVGSYSYDTQIGGSTTVAEFKIHKIKSIGHNE